MQLYEQYRPKCWAEVVGQSKVLDTIERLRPRGLSGRTYWITGQSGTGKTTIARLLAAEVADPWSILEFDTPRQLPVAEIDRIRTDYRYRPLGRGTCYVVNEAQPPPRSPF